MGLRPELLFYGVSRPGVFSAAWDHNGICTTVAAYSLPLSTTVSCVPSFVYSGAICAMASDFIRCWLKVVLVTVPTSFLA